MKPVVVTMVTDPTYTTWANKLMESCSTLGLGCMVIRRPDRGTWVENVAQKPSVIHYVLQRIDDDMPVLWIDADAGVLLGDDDELSPRGEQWLLSPAGR